MKFSLIIYETPETFATRHDPAHAAGYWAAWPAYTAALIEAGVLAGGAGLEGPDTAATIRFGAGGPQLGGQPVQGHQVQDGPFADTKEQLGGIYIIDVPDFDAAMKWAARMPLTLGGAVEVRPNLDMEQRQAALG